MKKLTYDHVKEQFESRNFILQSETYVNVKSKLDVICPVGHDFQICYNNFQQGKGCSVCHPYKITFEDVKRLFESRGSKLRSKIYVSAHELLEVTCPEGHDHVISYASFYQGHGCSTCNSGVSLMIEQVREQAEKDGNELLSHEYTNNHTKYKFRCPERHIF
jgi:RNA recognition motif-containing protein